MIGGLPVRKDEPSGGDGHVDAIRGVIAPFKIGGAGPKRKKKPPEQLTSELGSGAGGLDVLKVLFDPFAKFDDSEARDDHGEWTSSGGSGAPPKPIEKSEARGNSRPVSSSDFTALAKQGQDQYTALLSDSRPPAAFDDPAQWSSIKDSAYRACQESWGGQTISPADGHIANPPTGYALTIRSPGQSQITLPDNASADQFSDAMDKARTEYSEQLQGKKCYLGAFHDDDKGSIDIDPVAIVGSTQEVESIGAYTHAVGGAYDFATGDGVFPPHVGEEGDTSGAGKTGTDLYHFTTPENAAAMQSTGKMLSKEQGQVFFTTKPNTVYGSGFGPTRVHLRIPGPDFSKFELQDQFPNGNKVYATDARNIKPEHFIDSEPIDQEAMGQGPY